MHPVFFSVSGAETSLASKVWEKFPSNDIYLYSRSKDSGEWMWDDIERELSSANGIVIFWSKAYLANEGTRKELLRAKHLFGQYAQLRHALIVRLDDTPIHASPSSSPADAETYSALQSFTSATWYSQAGGDTDEITDLVDRLLLRVHGSESRPPLLRRPHLLDSLKRATRAPSGKITPVVWVEGLNGNGRRYLIRESHREYSPDAIPIEISFSETNLPKQLALRIASEALQYDEASLSRLNDDPALNTYAGIGPLVDECDRRNKYLVLVQTSLPTVTAQTIPEWLLDSLACIRPVRRPKVYVVSSVSCPPKLLAEHPDTISRVRVPWLTDDELSTFTDQLINHFDSERAGRWTNDLRQTVAEASGGTAKLLVDMVRGAARLDSLRDLEKWAGLKAEQFSERLSSFISWSLSQLPPDGTELQILRLMRDISPVSHQVLIELVGGPVNSSLTKLLELGVIECLDEDVFQMSPLLRRRINRSLNAFSESAEKKVIEALRSFAARKRSYSSSSSHIYLDIEAAVISGVRINGRPPEAVAKYVSAAQYFEVGLRLYDIGKRRDAFPLLKRAFEHRNEFGVTTRNEVTRYFGLAAVRLHKDEAVAQAIEALRGNKQGEGLVHYLEGFRAELDRQYGDAISHFKRAYELAIEEKSVQRQEHCSRALISVIRKSKQPNYKWAVQLAETAAQRSKTWFAALSLAQACLDRMYRDASITPSERDELHRLLSDALGRLERDPTGGNPLLSVDAYRLELEGDYDGAEMIAAKLAEGRKLEDLFRLWRLQLHGDDPIKLRAMANAAAAQLRVVGSRARDELLAPTLSFAVRALLKLGEKRSAQQLLDQYKRDLTEKQLWGMVQVMKGEKHHDLDYFDLAA